MTTQTKGVVSPRGEWQHKFQPTLSDERVVWSFRLWLEHYIVMNEEEQAKAFRERIANALRGGTREEVMVTALQNSMGWAKDLNLTYEEWQGLVTKEMWDETLSQEEQTKLRIEAQKERELERRRNRKPTLRSILKKCVQRQKPLTIDQIKQKLKENGFEGDELKWALGEQLERSIPPIHWLPEEAPESVKQKYALENKIQELVEDLLK